MIGLTDKPTLNLDEDLFDVKLYVEGLGSFIEECNTPMTIAIQGDWGSGKTSIMNMVDSSLSKGKIGRLWFNTWQYSQFNMGEDLPIALMSSMIKELGKGNTTKLKESLRIIKNCIKPGVIAFTEILGGERAAQLAVKAVGYNEETNAADAIRDLKKEFQTLIHSICRDSGKDRIVVFIDDLDRLQPEKAVELLEVLKLFLDCEECVFVLALDYEVVSQGISKKFGDNISRVKSRSFFDKIIQVPFKMPVAHYNIESFVLKSLKELKIDLSQENDKEREELTEYIDLILYSIGQNPRSIKRLFNAFNLLDKMIAKSEISQARRKKLLFSTLCMQLSFENCYNSIIAEKDSLDSGFFKAFDDDAAETNKDSRIQDFRDSVKDTDEDEWDAFMQFMKVLGKVISSKGKAISQDDIFEFVNVLKFSTITATGDAVARLPMGDHSVRYDVEYGDMEEHAIDGNIEKNNAPNGWNGAKFEGCHINGKFQQGMRLATLMDFIMQELYLLNPGKMIEVANDPNKFKLTSLFPIPPTSQRSVPHTIPDTNIQFETYSSNNEKMRLLRLLCKVLNFAQSDIIFKAKLAKRIQL